MNLSFTVPHYIYRQPGKIWEKKLILFCDASEVACATAAYMRATSTDGETVCHLLMAKTCLMPLKTISIPRGELMGCQLAVRLAETICEQLDLSMRDVKCLSDSTTALWWIYGEPRNFSPFVANRVAEVLTESDPTQWHHVCTKLNVADLATRGASASNIQAESPWIQGPEFFKSDESEWPIDDVLMSAPPVAEAELKRKVLRVEQASVPPLVDLTAYSTWIKLLHVTAWILRFCYNLRNIEQRKSGALTVEELKGAELYWIKWVQKNRFAAEVESLSKGRPVPRTSRVVSLDPQLVDGILCVGGRIDQAELPWEAKHPIILDHGHDVTCMIVIHSQSLADQFWRRWRREYVPHLIERSKWPKIQRNLHQGDLVLAVDDNAPRGQWCLGQVMAPIASADGLTRSAEVLTKSETCVRPVGKLALLEVHHEEDEE